ncbi:hypothetical protein FB451DRAFT_1187555 [Mycena latifolia]|nr:hypothetical protein FB451DRAFT_1187555 [Mycena latifolia]
MCTIETEERAQAGAAAAVRGGHRCMGSRTADARHRRARLDAEGPEIASSYVVRAALRGIFNGATEKLVGHVTDAAELNTLGPPRDWRKTQNGGARTYGARSRYGVGFVSAEQKCSTSASDDAISVVDALRRSEGNASCGVQTLVLLLALVRVLVKLDDPSRTADDADEDVCKIRNVGRGILRSILSVCALTWWQEGNGRW